MSTVLTARDNLDITAVKLNTVFLQKYNEQNSNPSLATVRSPLFKTMNTNLAAWFQETFAGVGYFRSTNETDNNVYDRTIVKNLLTAPMEERTLNIPMSKRYFETSNELHPILTATMQDFARKALRTQDRVGFGLYRGGFTSVRTPDGAPWFGTHNLIKGGTEVNFYSNATIPGGNSSLSYTNIALGIARLTEQKDQAGVTTGYLAKYLVVPTRLFASAVGICKAVLVPGGNNNDYNYLGQEYPLVIYHSPYLGSTEGGSDTAWFLLSEEHSATRIIRKDFEMEVVPWQYSNSNEPVVKGYYDETYFVSDYSGAFGFLGA